jgi:hypothetical protein
MNISVFSLTDQIRHRLRSPRHLAFRPRLPPHNARRPLLESVITTRLLARLAPNTIVMLICNQDDLASTTTFRHLVRNSRNV